MYHFKRVRTFTIHKFHCLVIFNLFLYSMNNDIFLRDLENNKVFLSENVFYDSLMQLCIYLTEIRAAEIIINGNFL